MKIAAVLLMAVAFAACSKSSPAGPTSPSVSDTTVSFASQVQPIFTESCAVPGCHVTGGIAPMSLQVGKAYGDIVNVPSIEQLPYIRVKPYDADSSYLYLKITGRAGTRMPLNKAPLDSSNIATIRTWINQGAKNN